MAVKNKGLAIATAPNGTWVQTERKAHELWAKLSIANPRAASVLHVMISQIGRNNALVTSQGNLARLSGCSLPTLKRALTVLREQNWIQLVQIGPTGTACAYVINDRVAWQGSRDGIRYSLFSASVLVSDDEQPDRKALDTQAPLTRLPSLYPGERQLPAGDGLPPPSQPTFVGFENDLPATEAID
jgi:hypothetical protein